MLKVHFDCMEVVNAISKREQSVLTEAALIYSKIKKEESLDKSKSRSL